MSRDRLFAVFVIMIWMMLSAPAFGENILLPADEWPPFNCSHGSSKEGVMVDAGRRRA